MRLNFVPFLILIAFASLTGCQDAETPNPAPDTSTEPGQESPASPENEVPPSGAIISGHASVELRIDRTQVLSGIELVLIPADLEEDIMRIRNERWLILASRFNFNDGYNNLDLTRIGGHAVQHALATTRADAEGTYRFTGIDPGNYLIYGQYKSRYAAGFWLVPVTVESTDDELSIHLTQENMKEIHNRNLRGWGE